MVVNGSHRHLSTPLSLLYSPCSEPPASPRPLPPLAAVVIGYDTGSTGRESQDAFECAECLRHFSFSNLLPCSSPSLSALPLPWQHLRDRISPHLLFFLHVVSFIKIGRKCLNECARERGALQQRMAGPTRRSEPITAAPLQTFEAPSQEELL